MKDEYTMSHVCNKVYQDGSTVEYKIEGGIRMVYQEFLDGTKRKAQYEDGKWITI